MNCNPPPFPDPSKPPGVWTLATFNVQDLFDTADDPYAHDEQPTDNELRNKMTRLSRVLHILAADVVGLMEVETLGVLQRLNQDYLADLGYREAILLEGNDPERGIDVALLTRFTVAQVVSHVGDTYIDSMGQTRRVFSRDCLECHITLPDGETLVVLVNHFKSKRGGKAETEEQRMAQASRVRALVESLTRLYPLLAVVGDLNDAPASASSRLVRGEGTALSLIDIASDVPPDHRYTFVHMGVPERIDYLLASPALAARFVPNSVLIPHDAFAAHASDHDPIRAAFAFAGVPASAYETNLTLAYDALHPPVRRRRSPMRINAARFFVRELHALRGQLVIVTGVVRHVEVTRGTGVIRFFLGHADPRRAFQATLFPNMQNLFRRVGISDITGYYRGKLAQGVGRLDFYRGIPEIAIETPGQLKVIHPEEGYADGRHRIQF